ncbi:MAG TPA: dTDP-glucose 4,6-dehydratase [Candidatus Binatia bacterium]|jgi:dTDP-glucose 4,6-dehydratase
MNIFVTGGAGFIGSNFLRLSVPRRAGDRFTNVDKLTYAANPANLDGIDALPNYALERVDIADAAAVDELFARLPPDLVVHFAAESHVDRSIVSPGDFVHANIVGTFNLLQAFRTHSASRSGALFHHVSTDEVYGSLGQSGRFTETTRYDPSSPYSASKAASDHLVRAYGRTYGLPVKITNCSNNYGPYQFPEKLIPLMILNALDGKPLPVYGKGLNVRDWLYVEDHCEAIWAVIERGATGETYNVGGDCELTNIDVVARICRVLAEETGCPLADFESLVTYVADRPGHDLRYAIDASRTEKECGWSPQHTFDDGLRATVRWYLGNRAWVDGVRSGDYLRWIEHNYGRRASAAS